jgi:ABC-type sulfate transport system substrate-binding protein
MPTFARGFDRDQSKKHLATAFVVAHFDGRIVGSWRRAVWVALLLALSGVQAQAQFRDVLVFAAASLKNALDEANSLFLFENGSGVRVSYGASSALAKQIESGAPADVFISADLDWMDYVAERKLIKPDTRAKFPRQPAGARCQRRQQDLAYDRPELPARAGAR